MLILNECMPMCDNSGLDCEPTYDSKIHIQWIEQNLHKVQIAQQGL